MNVIKKLEVILSVRICETRMSMREVMGMTPGSIIELPTSAEDNLDVLVGGKQIGAGRAVKIGENFGVSIQKVGKLEVAERRDDDVEDGGEFDPEAFADALLAAQ